MLLQPRNRLTAFLHLPRLRARVDDAAMLANPPLESEATHEHTIIVWPLDLLDTVDGSRRVVGFLMPRVTGMAPIIDFYNPRARRQQRPWFDYYRLHHTARNLATA